MQENHAMTGTVRAMAAAAVLAAAGATRATSIFVEGVITQVPADLKGYTVKGYDHYNHKRYEDKITDIPVKIAANGTFVLDDRLVRREMALAVGRSAYSIGSSAGGSINVVLSAPAGRTVGQVAGVEGGKLKLKVVQGMDSYEKDVPLDAAAVLLDEAGKPAARDAVLAPGKLVRAAPARGQTAMAFSQKAFADMIPKGVPTAVCGVLKKAPGANGIPTLAVARGDAIEEFTPEAKKALIVYDVWGDTCHGAILKPQLSVGQPAVFIAYEKRPGKVDSYLIVQAPDAGRVEGTVKGYDPAKRELTVRTLLPDGFKDVTAALAPDAAVTLDGAAVKPADALKAGVQVSLYAPRPQTIQAVQGPEPAKH